SVASCNVRINDLRMSGSVDPDKVLRELLPPIVQLDGADKDMALRGGAQIVEAHHRPWSGALRAGNQNTGLAVANVGYVATRNDNAAIGVHGNPANAFALGNYRLYFATGNGYPIHPASAHIAEVDIPESVER